MFNRKINTGLIALVIGVSTAFAFNEPAKKPASALAVQWFLYNGLGISDPNNYTEVASMPSCNSGSTLCAIQAPEDGSTGRPTQAGVDAPKASKNKP